MPVFNHSYAYNLLKYKFNYNILNEKINYKAKVKYFICIKYYAKKKKNNAIS